MKSSEMLSYSGTYAFVLLGPPMWFHDQARWVASNPIPPPGSVPVVTPLPQNFLLLKMHYFHNLTPDGPLPMFKTHGYILNSDESLVIVHYIGDHSVAEDYPHGNSSKMHTFFAHSAIIIVGRIGNN